MRKWAFEFSFDIDLDNGVIFEKIYGSWRLSTAQHYSEEFERETVDLIKKPWAKLCDLSNWKTGSPEVIATIAKHLEWCRAHNMIWSVNIINNTVTYSQLQKMFERGGTKGMSKTFRTREEGGKFLKEQGFKIKSPNGMGQRG
ncbi:MAG TPA: hypothetical protein VJ983_06120 [candidate division Zixibacteria bacterium]|nr:hypothetical protein [candidate division Zixibacteria bacterium]